ncbi:hypothetical protein OUZ56_016248 [Daphnia magna]|uniref:Uncharacterized protein n=1 Tax=Daphnia magna TaxID=35525 RepID=A0ABR0AQ78_9CRUS|nr:hypothetical protein OUZ56_016248 [Daphnia magna]
MLRKELKDGQHENWEQMMGDVCFAYHLESDTTLEHRDNIPLTEDNADTLQSPKTDIDLQPAGNDTIVTERLNEDKPENDTLEITLLTSQPDSTIVTTDPTFTVQQARNEESISSEELNQIGSYWNTDWDSYYEESLIRPYSRQETPWQLISFGDPRYQDVDPDDPVYIAACRDLKEKQDKQAIAEKEEVTKAYEEALAKSKREDAILVEKKGEIIRYDKGKFFPLPSRFGSTTEPNDWDTASDLNRKLVCQRWFENQEKNDTLKSFGIGMGLLLGIVNLCLQCSSIGNIKLIQVYLQKMLLYLMLTTILCITALAFETIICNCDNPSAKEHLRTNDENCPSLLKPTQKEVDYMLWTNRRAGNKFQASICGRWMTINHITTDFFGQQIIVPETVALETSLTECTIMDPPTIGSWFSTVSPYVINCMMEETRLIRQGADDIIETLSENQMFQTEFTPTIISRSFVATAFDNTPRLVSSGEGALIKTSTPGTFRLEDEK